MQQKQASDGISLRQTLRLLTSEKALTQWLIGQEPASSLSCFWRLLHLFTEMQKWVIRGIICIILILFLLINLKVSWITPAVLSGLAFIFLLWVLGAVLWYEKNRQTNRALRHLWEKQIVSRATWPQALPALLALMKQTGWPRDDELHVWWFEEVYPVLVRWLPRMQPGELSAEECETLRKLLRLNHSSEDLQVAILLALGTARDEKVRQMAHQIHYSSPYERVREAARDCLRELGEPVSRRLERRD